MSVSHRLPGGLDPEDWSIALSVFGAIKAAIPDANKREPGEVMNFVLEAIRSCDAKFIEPCPSVATALPNTENPENDGNKSNINNGIAELANRSQTGDRVT